ncbi:unnamed protein product [Microthlaspi erraticum]|uniref:Knottins-like domain-containing protein n=1 Tax=Microthlaspi erraticum TaxID=1685480 RepID=A0A6D2JQ41_9BRAS|nr:unnamed protein product [Microthlaspi erraticum]
MRLISAVLLLFMIFVVTGMGPVAVEARTCESASHKFKGTCLSESNCGNVCHGEGFSGGRDLKTVGSRRGDNGSDGRGRIDGEENHRSAGLRLQRRR